MQSAMQAFLQTHRLPDSYVAESMQWFEPLAERLAMHRQQAGRPLVIGINGSQGSGKSTLASLLCLLLDSVLGLRALDLSIDDFYLTRAQRRELADQVHPLLATRGVPGTHDAVLMSATLQALCADGGMVPIPRFDKARDDRVPADLWQRVDAPLDLLIIEGWCLGTPPEPAGSLDTPCNALEREEDPDGSWRRYVNTSIERQYRQVYDMVDVWVMLAAPSFECVYRWRLEQEQKLAAKVTASGGAGAGVMSEPELARFIQHYQRLTEQSLRSLPGQVNYLFRLDEDRKVIDSSEPQPVTPT